jgi:hypothetical protein
MYSIDPGAARGPYAVSVELVFQPIGYRWAHNLDPYDAPEPRRFVGYYQSMQSETAVVLAHTQAVVPRQ